MGYSACETLTFPPAVPCGLPAQPGILDQASTSSLALYWDPYNQLSSSHSLSSEVTSHQQCRPGGHLQLPNYETPVPAHHYRYPESQTMNNCSPNQDTNYRLSSSQYRLPKLPSNSPPVHHPSSLSRMRKTSVKGPGIGFDCTYCNRAFTRKGDLRRHEQTKHHGLHAPNHSGSGSQSETKFFRTLTRRCPNPRCQTTSRLDNLPKHVERRHQDVWRAITVRNPHTLWYERCLEYYRRRDSEKDMARFQDHQLQAAATWVGSSAERG